MAATRKAQSLGGKAKSAKVRAAYVPKLCAYCSTPIVPVHGELLSNTKSKKFCNKSCAAKHNNATKPKRKRTTTKCEICGCDGLYHRRLCNSCRDAGRLENKTKNEAGRSMIANHARYIMATINKSCAVCGYDKAVQVCHIKAVKHFSGDTKLKDINTLSNLVMLCPNHHWELDHLNLVLHDEPGDLPLIYLAILFTVNRNQQRSVCRL